MWAAHTVFFHIGFTQLAHYFVWRIPSGQFSVTTTCTGRSRYKYLFLLAFYFAKIKCCWFASPCVCVCVCNQAQFGTWNVSILRNSELRMKFCWQLVGKHSNWTLDCKSMDHAVVGYNLCALFLLGFAIVFFGWWWMCFFSLHLLHLVNWEAEENRFLSLQQFGCFFLLLGFAVA